MNEGITFEEACRLSLQGLTSEQIQNCPGQETSSLSYLYAGIIGVVLMIALTVFIVVKLKRSK